jgi:hypothetical protein
MADFFYFLIAFSLGFFAIGILISNANIPINTAIMRIVGRDKLSKVSSIISIGSQGMTPIAAVLAGIILSLLGQKVPPLQAAACGAWFHGRAGDLAAESGMRGLLPTDMVALLPRLLK